MFVNNTLNRWMQQGETYLRENHWGVPDEHRARGSDAGQETMRADITPVFWSDRGAHHDDHGTDVTRKPNRLRSPQQSRQHGPLLEKVGYIRTMFSKTPGSHIGSIDMDECAPI